jgi:hypothetical protein
MLGKLIKYEFKATARLFLYAYLAIIVLAAVNLVLEKASGSDVTIFEGIFGGLFALAIIAVSVITLVVIVVRYYRNLLGNEGYLMFTLPVKTHSLILSKLIVGFVWTVATAAVCILGVLIISAGPGDFFRVCGDAIAELGKAGYDVNLWIFCIVLLLITCTVCSILEFYAAMSIGPHITKNRLGGSILGYIIIVVVTQIAVTLVLFIGYGRRMMEGFGPDGALTLSDGTTLTAQSEISDGMLYDPVLAHSVNSDGLQLLAVCIVINVAVAAGCMILSNYMLKRKLNLA